jgi:sugar lactone lactonase YvrE
MRLPLLAITACLACAREGADQASHAAFDTAAMQDSTHRVATITGLSGPEAVRYDPDQDVYFVSNFNGPPSGDANGFVSRVRPDGAIDSLRFMTGTTAAPLHGPRGMFITGDTLWVADAEGVHLFQRRTGTHLRFVDMRRFSPGFLNDIVQGPDGAIYITDTGASRVYRIAGDSVTTAITDEDLGAPNGITWDSANSRFLLASWNAGTPVRTWDGRSAVTEIGTAGGGRNDGIELVGDMVLIASQSDSAINVLQGGTVRRAIRVPGAPADIGIDTRRSRVAVPYVALNRVDIWEIPRAP